MQGTAVHSNSHTVELCKLYLKLHATWLQFLAECTQLQSLVSGPEFSTASLYHFSVYSVLPVHSSVLQPHVHAFFSERTCFVRRSDLPGHLALF